MRFLVGFSAFGSILGGSVVSENCKKFLKIDSEKRSGRVWIGGPISVAISECFCKILMDFGRVRVVFWKGFGGITNDYKRLRLQNLL